jgi:hypothetical protein
MPIKYTFDFDTDEGINLIKALLYSQGFSLYTDIANDQPPLFTVLLSYWFRLFGQTVVAGRFLTLVFSTLLIWSFYHTLRLHLSHFLATTSTLLLVFSSEFLQLSVSVMIGIPALSLAMLSIYTLTLYRRISNQYLLLGSGFLLALSLQTKFFTVLLIPVVVIFYLLDFKVNRVSLAELKSRILPTIGLWLSTIFIVYLVIGFVFNSIDFQQVFYPHLAPEIKETLKDYGNLRTIASRLIYKNYILTSLALLGIVRVIAKKHWDGLFPLVWLVITSLLLLNHRPIWYHHYHLLSIPLSWMAAYGIISVFNSLKTRLRGFNFNRINPQKILIYSCIFILFLGSSLSIIYYPAIKKSIAKQKQDYYQQLEAVHLLSKHSKPNQWVFTDSPIYAFYANLPVPPEIAVFSIKQFVSGNLNHADLYSILSKYRPAQILLLRFWDSIKNDKKIMDYIEKNYTKIQEVDAGAYYVWKINGYAKPQ